MILEILIYVYSITMYRKITNNIIYSVIALSFNWNYKFQKKIF